MQAKEVLNEKLKREYQVSIPSSLIESKIVGFLKEKGKTYKMQGFRPGKVPLDRLKKIFYSQALQASLEEVLEESSQEVLKKNQVRPALRPEFHLGSFEEGQDFEYRMTFEIVPEVSKVAWGDLSLIQHKVILPSEQVEEELAQFARSKKNTRPLVEDRPAQKGDRLIVDIEMEMTVRGEKESERLEGIDFELGAGYFVPEIEESLVGLKQGATIEREMTIPPKVKDRKWVGKPFNFKVHIKEVRETVPFEVDEAFAKALKFTDLEECREAFRAKLQKKADKLGFLALKRQVLDYFAKKYPFDVPEKMVEMEFQSIWKGALFEIGLSQSANENEKVEDRERIFKERAGKGEEDLKKDYLKIARRRVCLGFIITEIGKQQNVSLTQEDINHALAEKKAEFPERDIVRYYKENEGARASLQASLFEDKIVNFIASQASRVEQEISFKDLEEFLEKSADMGADMGESSPAGESVRTTPTGADMEESIS